MDSGIVGSLCSICCCRKMAAIQFIAINWVMEIVRYCLVLGKKEGGGGGWKLDLLILEGDIENVYIYKFLCKMQFCPFCCFI